MNRIASLFAILSGLFVGIHSFASESSGLASDYHCALTDLRSQQTLLFAAARLEEGTQRQSDQYILMVSNRKGTELSVNVRSKASREWVIAKTFPLNAKRPDLNAVQFSVMSGDLSLMVLCMREDQIPPVFIADEEIIDSRN
jgi:hypothetical protein